MYTARAHSCWRGRKSTGSLIDTSSHAHLFMCGSGASSPGISATHILLNLFYLSRFLIRQDRASRSALLNPIGFKVTCSRRYFVDLPALSLRPPFESLQYCA